MFDWLTDAMSGSPVAYWAVLLASGGDVVFPPVPSETIVIGAGVLAAQGELVPWLIVPAAAAGALIGSSVPSRRYAGTAGC